MSRAHRAADAGRSEDRRERIVAPGRGRRRVGSRPPLADIADRHGQDELLQIRNDLMTVYREIGGGDERLFPLRYARAGAIRDGRRTARREEDSTGLPPILILPDGPALASVLPYDVLRRMMSQRGLDVIMMEHRGVGLSRLDAEGEDLPDEAMRIEAVVGDVLAILDHARVDRAVLYGVGYGACVAQLVAALHPERVHSLVLDSPWTSTRDEAAGQRRFLEAYRDGADPGTAGAAATLRSLMAEGVIDGHRAGPSIAAVHEFGGPSAVRDLVELLGEGRGALTWRSIGQVLTRDWMQSTPYVRENDLVARIAHTELGMGSCADGSDLDPLQLQAAQARAVAPFAGAPLDVPELSRGITAPTLVISGREDLATPPESAREAAERIHGASLLELPGVGHSILDAHPGVAIIAAWWSAAGCADLLTERAEELAALPRTSLNRAVGQGLRIALLAERIAPWKLRLETARQRRTSAVSTGRRAGHHRPR